MNLIFLFVVAITAMLNLQTSALKIASKLKPALKNSFSALGTVARIRNLPEVNVEPSFMFGAVMPGNSTVQLKVYTLFNFHFTAFL